MAGALQGQRTPGPSQGARVFGSQGAQPLKCLVSLLQRLAGFGVLGMIRAAARSLLDHAAHHALARRQRQSFTALLVDTPTYQFGEHTSGSSANARRAAAAASRRMRLTAGAGAAQRVLVRGAAGGVGVRGGHLLLGLLLLHLLAQEARPDARAHLFQRAHLARRRPPLRLCVPAVLVSPHICQLSYVLFCLLCWC